VIVDDGTATRWEPPMPISDIPILSMLRTKMQWHQERQRLLAENVANAETPSFRPRDLMPPKFDDRLPATASGAMITLASTDPSHITGAGFGGTGQFEQAHQRNYQVRPTGNSVSLEDEMLKVAANNLDYQTATSLYSKSLGLLKIALGKK
jgi:flagellar basal-body rod protein FlgB